MPIYSGRKDTSEYVIDGEGVAFGTDQDAVASHSGSAFSLVNATGNTTIQSSGVTSSIIAKLGTTSSATKFAVQDSAGTELFSVGGGGAMTFPGDITFADSSTIAVSGSSGSTLTLTLDAVNAGAGEGRLALNADEQVNINDGTLDLQLDGGAVTETGMVSLDLTPSGAMTLRGGGVSQFGDDTGYVAFDGSGAVSTSGVTTLDVDASGAVQINSSAGPVSIANDNVAQAANFATAGARAVSVGAPASTSLSLEAGVGALSVNADAASTMTIGTSLTVASPLLNVTGNVVGNSDATAAATNAPFFQLQDGDAVAAPNDDLVKVNVGLDAVNEVLELSLTRQRNGGAVAQIGAHLSIGRVGEVTASVDALLDLRSANDASAARVATITHLGQEGAVEVSSPTAGLDLALVGTGEVGIKGAAADAQHSASLSGSQLNLGAGGATAPDFIFARQAANVGEFASGDSAYIVGAASIGRRNASADANFTAALGANGLELGAGGATAPTWAVNFQAANVAEMASGDSLYAVGTAFVGRRALAADANPTVAMSAVGLELGAGGATAPTVSLAFQAADVAELGSGDSLYAVAGTMGIRALSADANATAALSGSSLSLGVGGATAVDWVLSRQAANIAEMASGDSLFSVGTAFIGRRALAADANPTVSLSANGLELGVGGATALDWLLSRSGVGIAGIADSKSFTWGTSQDTGISHDGTNTVIDHNTGELILAMGTRAFTQDPEIGAELKRLPADSGATALDNADGTTTLTLDIPSGARIIAWAANVTTAIADVSLAGVTVAIALTGGSSLALGNLVTGGDGNLAANTKNQGMIDPNQAGLVTTGTTQAEVTISGGVDNTPSAGAIRLVVWYETVAALDSV